MPPAPRGAGRPRWDGAAAPGSAPERGRRSSGEGGGAPARDRAGPQAPGHATRDSTAQEPEHEERHERNGFF